MDELPPQKRPRRRWPKIAIGILLAALLLYGFGKYSASQRQDQLLTNAASVQLGQTEAEVMDILGQWDIKYNTGANTGLCYGRSMNSPLRLIDAFVVRPLNMPRVSPPIDLEDFPIDIRFDAKGQVDRIEYGDKVIE